MEHFYLFNKDEIEWSCRWTDGIITPCSEFRLSKQYNSQMLLDPSVGTCVHHSAFNQIRNGEKTLDFDGKKVLVNWLFDTERNILLVLQIASRFAIMGINPLEYLRACLNACEPPHYDAFYKQLVSLDELFVQKQRKSLCTNYLGSCANRKRTNFPRVSATYPLNLFLPKNMSHHRVCVGFPFGVVEWIPNDGVELRENCRILNWIEIDYELNLDVAFAYIATFGGGLVSGDNFMFTVDIGANSKVVILSQSATKIYSAHLNQYVLQKFVMDVAAEAVLMLLPDPVICYENSRFFSDITVNLSARANAMVLDWVTCGREMLGEVWSLADYANKISIYHENAENDKKKLIFRDSTSLSKTGQIPLPSTLHGCALFGCFIIHGTKLAPAFAQLEPFIVANQKLMLETIGSSKKSNLMDKFVLATFSKIGEFGAVIRFSGKNAQRVREFVTRLVSLCQDVIGLDPWKLKENL